MCACRPLQTGDGSTSDLICDFVYSSPSDARRSRALRLWLPPLETLAVCTMRKILNMHTHAAVAADPDRDEQGDVSQTRKARSACLASFTLGERARVDGSAETGN